MTEQHNRDMEQAISKVTEKYEIQARRHAEEIKNLHNQEKNVQLYYRILI